jgi:hypothetical protein
MIDIPYKEKEKVLSRDKSYNPGMVASSMICITVGQLCSNVEESHWSKDRDPQCV